MVDEGGGRAAACSRSLSSDGIAAEPDRHVAHDPPAGRRKFAPPAMAVGPTTCACVGGLIIAESTTPHPAAIAYSPSARHVYTKHPDRRF